jgi:hypothetical protein
VTAQTLTSLRITLQWAFLKEMADNDFRFENTEVCCFLAGSEEAGIAALLLMQRA